MKKEKYIVKGMTCSACSAAVQNNVSKKNGIQKCNVNLLSETMEVEYNEKVITEKEIFDIVRNLGYSPYQLNTKFDKNKDTAVILKRNFFLSLFFLIPLLVISNMHMIGIEIPYLSITKNSEYFALAQLILTVPILIINFHFFFKGFKLIFKLSPNMDSLVTLGSLASFIYSFLITILLIFQETPTIILGVSHHLYYESSAMILVLVTLGKYLEAKSKKKTGKAIEELYKFVPDYVIIEKDGISSRVSINEVNVGDIIIVKQDEYIPVDGTVIDGTSFIDKSAITGESIPSEVSVGDYVTSATINKSGVLKILVLKVKEETTIAKIIKMVQEAGSSKAPIEKLADKISLYFVPVVCLISVLTFGIWMVLTQGQFDYSINNAICVLVISCPCALGLATPIAIMVATGKAAKFGILFKDAESLQLASKINVILFDKTGTLTKGEPSVIKFLNFSRLEDDEILKIAYGLENNSSHPLSYAIKNFANTDKENIIKINNYKYHKGLGGIGYHNNQKYLIGNLRLLQENNILFDYNIIEKINIEYYGKTISYLANENELMGVFVIADTIKDSSKDTISKLKKRGIKTVLITGDSLPTAKSIGYELGIEEIHAEVLPEDKLELVKKYKENNIVAFVGDGINDSPALKEAHIGIAIATGNDIAIDCANIVLASQSLDSINTLIRLSKKTVNNIKINLFWAFFYNVIGIFIAAGFLTYVGIVLTPMIGAAAMSLSSLFVVTNALRLQRFKVRNERIKFKTMKKTIKIEGMMCMHCVARVEKALASIPNISKVTVNLKKKIAVIEFTDLVSDDSIKNVITDAGYEVINIE